MIGLALALCSLLAPLGGDDGPPQRAPAADAPPLTVFMTTAKAGALRYSWVLPKGYDGKTPRNLSVILHGTGLDYRWGHWNNKPGIFRPEDVVVSVDGTSPASDGKTRLFLGEPKDAELFKKFLEELRATFVVDRVFLYGHSQGGFFVPFYMGLYPDTVAGGVAHSSGAWNWSKTPKELKKLALVFMHGSSDPVVPYGQSPGSRDFYVEHGFALTHLRRLAYWNHWPNAVRATEELDWCQGMTTSDPKEALDCALRMLRNKPVDEYQWTSVVDFSGARLVLERLTGKGPAPIAQAPEDVAKDAREWLAKIDAQADEQVKALRAVMPKKGALALDGKPWLGQLLPLREDFRGVEAVEKFLTEIGFDKAVEAQAKATKPIWDVWFAEGKKDSERAVAVLESIGKCFLVDGLPWDMRDQMGKWQKAKLDVGAKNAKKWSDWENYAKGIDDGWKQYESIWKKWKGPDAKH
jgi:predicted esterase